ncbi:hypothetical protein [Saccharothrix sp. HUAS TT1]|uniref:hypothetical protein n=1 Tax=unclassified Saccharothrix TaxID=2593673 RepID=UPI00345BEAA6
MAPEWTYTVHDLLTNALLAELPLTGVGYNLVLNDSGSLGGSFSVDRRRNPRGVRVRDPYNTTMPCRTCVYAWRDDVPQWGGIIWTRKYDSTTGVVNIQAADWWSYFDHRKVLPLLSFPVAVEFEIAELAVSQVGQDQNDIARYLVELAQSHAGGDLGLVLDATTSGIDRDRTWRGFELADVGEELRRLSQVLDGPDIAFGVSPSVDPVTGRPVRTMRTGDPMLGQQGAAWVWEYGANVTSYTWPSDGTRYAARTIAVGNGMEYGTPVAVSESRPIGWPLTETETSYSSVSEPDTLQEHADSDQIVSRLPVVLPTLTVRGDRTPRIGEWGIGDDGRVQIEDDFHTTGIETSMRIVRADVTPADDGQDETVVFTMAPLLDDVA